MKLKQTLLTGVFTLTALASMATLSTLTTWRVGCLAG